MSCNDVLIYVSGLAGGFLVCWYWLVRPMARLLGFDKHTTEAGNPLTPEWTCPGCGWCAHVPLSPVPGPAE